MTYALMFWVSTGALVGAGVFLCLWLKARGDAKDWAMVATVLGDEYDKLVIEVVERQRGQRTVEQAKWLN